MHLCGSGRAKVWNQALTAGHGSFGQNPTAVRSENTPADYEAGLAANEETVYEGVPYHVILEDTDQDGIYERKCLVNTEFDCPLSMDQAKSLYDRARN